MKQTRLGKNLIDMVATRRWTGKSYRNTKMLKPAAIYIHVQSWSMPSSV